MNDELNISKKKLVFLKLACLLKLKEMLGKCSYNFLGGNMSLLFLRKNIIYAIAFFHTLQKCISSRSTVDQESFTHYKNNLLFPVDVDAVFERQEMSLFLLICSTCII